MRQVDWPWLFQFVVIASVPVCVAIPNLTSYRNFFYDEWSFIEYRRPWTFLLILLPHGNHWSPHST